MISTGRVSEPAIVSDDECFAERWLSNGDPYEFSSTPTVEGGAPPDDLVARFKHRLETLSESIKQSHPEFRMESNLTDLLGIYYVHDPDSSDSGDDSGLSFDSFSARSSQAREDVIWFETTEGRRNIVRPVPREEAGSIPNAVPAAWFITSEPKPGANPSSDDDWIIKVSTGCSCLDDGKIHTSKWVPPEEDGEPECTPGPGPGPKRSLIVDFAGLEKI